MVSVIIPVYNKEKYLPTCLDSVLGQTLTDLEVICVDDGSTDRCPEILEKYAKKDSRVRVLHQQNQYAGVARNRGIEEAKGAYLYFLDADDFIDKDFLEHAYKRAKETDADLVLMDGDSFEDSDRSFHEHDTYLKTEMTNGHEVFSMEDISDHVFNISVGITGTRFVRREFVLKRNLRFSALHSTNDIYFCYMAVILAERISYITDKGYHYRIGITGNLQNLKDKNPQNSVMALEEIYYRLEQEGLLEKLEKPFAEFVLNALGYNVRTLYSHESTIALTRRVCEPDGCIYKLLAHPAERYPLRFRETYYRFANAPSILRFYEKYYTKQEVVTEEVIVNPDAGKDTAPAVSVIVPTYQCGQYIEQCIRSALDSTLKDIEVICVNDGSTDSTQEILERIARQDCRLRLFVQENSGQGAARNAAIRNARGEYLYYLDSDDVLNPKALEILVNRARKDKLDILSFDARAFEDEDFGNGTTEIRSSLFHKGQYEGTETGIDLFRKMCRNREYQSALCVHMDRRQYLFDNGIIFEGRILHEDTAYTFRAFAGAERAGHEPITAFYRRLRRNSAMMMVQTFDSVYGAFHAFLDISNEMEKLPDRYRDDENCARLLRLLDHIVRQRLTNLSEIDRRIVYAMKPEEQSLFFDMYEYCMREEKNYLFLQRKLNRLTGKPTSSNSVSKVPVTVQTAGANEKLPEEPIPGIRLLEIPEYELPRLIDPDTIWEELVKKSAEIADEKEQIRYVTDRLHDIENNVETFEQILAVQKKLCEPENRIAVILNRPGAAAVCGQYKDTFYRFSQSDKILKYHDKLYDRTTGNYKRIAGPEQTDAEPLVSVIIAANNCAEHLGRCLDSVLQDDSLKNIEVICVDDGSDDGTLDVMRDYAQKDDRIQVLSGKNLGLGDAKNAGLETARGRYVFFPDTNDCLIPGQLEKAVERAEEFSLDVLCVEGECDAEDDCKLPNRNHEYEDVYIGTELLIRMAAFGEYNSDAGCLVLRREFLNGERTPDGKTIRFTERVDQEGEAFAYETLLRAKRAGCARVKTHLHTIRNSSGTEKKVDFPYFYGYYVSYMRMREVLSGFPEEIRNNPRVLMPVNQVYTNVRMHYFELPEAERRMLFALRPVERVGFETLFELCAKKRKNYLFVQRKYEAEMKKREQ